MLEKYYVRSETVDRIRSSWIGASIEQYVQWLTERQYSTRTVLRRIPILVRFGEFAKASGALRLEDLPEKVEPFVREWVAEHCRAGTSGAEQKKISDSTRNPIRQMLRLALPGYVHARLNTTGSTSGSLQPTLSMFG